MFISERRLQTLFGTMHSSTIKKQEEFDSSFLFLLADFILTQENLSSVIKLWKVVAA